MIKKNSVLMVRISNADKKILKRKAEREGRSMASYLLWAAGLYEDKSAEGKQPSKPPA